MRRKYFVLVSVSSFMTIYLIRTLILFHRTRPPASSNISRSLLLGTICTNNILDSRERDLSKWSKESDNALISQTSSFPCRLLEYNRERAVKCLDILNRERIFPRFREPNIDSTISTKKDMLEFVFIGDSRIRQHFFNFLKLIPDYDRKTEPNPIPPLFHADIEVTSEILRIRVLFKWRPLIADQVLTDIIQYSSAIRNQLPDWVLIGMALHHMIPKHNATLPVYQKRMELLGLHLDKLGALAKVIWLHQYPIIDSYEKNGDHYSYMSTEKIRQYNEVVRSTFQSFRNIHVWDSSNKVAEEYIRGCNLIERYGTVDYALAYTANCKDSIHTGNIALSEATQLLFNDICNIHFSHL